MSKFLSFQNNINLSKFTRKTFVYLNFEERKKKNKKKDGIPPTQSNAQNKTKNHVPATL